MSVQRKVWQNWKRLWESIQTLDYNLSAFPDITRDLFWYLMLTLVEFGMASEIQSFIQ